MNVAMNPLVLHIVRPYADETEYLANEAWTIEARGMLLVEQAELELDSTVIFDVTLDDGSKPIRAEGRVVGYAAATEERLGGVRIRFRRFGAQTKAFIERAGRAREEQLARTSSSRPPRSRASVPPLSGGKAPSLAPLSTAKAPSFRPPPRVPSAPPAPSAKKATSLPPSAIQNSTPETPAGAAPIVEAQQAPAVKPLPPFAPEAATEASARSLSVPEASGIHPRPYGLVKAPPNRDQLLQRLRHRAQNLGLEAAESLENSAKNASL